MSRAAVGMVIEKLLTEEILRMRFALDRVETVAALCLRGFDLEPDEIALFCRSDPEMWFVEDHVTREWQH